MSDVQEYAIERMYSASDYRMTFGRGCEFKLSTAKALARRRRIVLCEQIDEYTATYELSESSLFWMREGKKHQRNVDFYDRCRKDPAFSRAMIEQLKDVSDSFSEDEYMHLYTWIANLYRDIDHTALTVEFLNMIEYDPANDPR